QHKHGIKIWCANDSQNFYLHNAKIYAGRGNDEETSTPEKTVLNLTTNLRYSGRTFTMDNFFTSIPLAEKLLAERTYVVGTIRPKRYAIPNDFVDDEASSCIYHENLSLTKFQTKKEKRIFLLWTKHSRLMECDPENGQETGTRI
uniref:PiggyBac transposable element-derived protein domain-containing protein n=1 Tax=Romanomermis culicivorax TaxID=13658 RepID=A0A915L2H9_ROMCU